MKYIWIRKDGNKLVILNWKQWYDMLIKHPNKEYLFCFASTKYLELYRVKYDNGFKYRNIWVHRRVLENILKEMD